MATSKDKFLPNYDDNEIIYWEDDWMCYKFPNKITEKNRQEAEWFDAYNNIFFDFSNKTVDEIADLCFTDNRNFWHEISEESYNRAKNDVLERLKNNS